MRPDICASGNVCPRASVFSRDVFFADVCVCPRRSVPGARIEAFRARIVASGRDIVMLAVSPHRGSAEPNRGMVCG